MQIVLAAALVLAVAWFAVLRPHGETSSSSAAASPAAPARAQGASNAPARRARAAVRAQRRRAAARAHRRRAAATARHRAPDPAAPVLAALDDHRVAVLLFWDGRTADDRAVRSAVAHVDRHHGRVRVFVARLGAVADFAAIVSSAGVTASPTVLVIDAERQVRKISGLTVASEIDQAVQDALHASPATR
jgi:hypothetical protein